MNVVLLWRLSEVSGCVTARAVLCYFKGGVVLLLRSCGGAVRAAGLCYCKEACCVL